MYYNVTTNTSILQNATVNNHTNYYVSFFFPRDAISSLNSDLQGPDLGVLKRSSSQLKRDQLLNLKKKQKNKKTKKKQHM